MRIFEETVACMSALSEKVDAALREENIPDELRKEIKALILRGRS